MSTQQRKGARASTAKKKPEVHNLKAAYIIPQEKGDALIQSLGELPSKYYQSLVGPMMGMLQQTFRGDITVTIDPNKPAPMPALGPQGVQPPGGTKPTVKHPAAKKPVIRKAPAK